MLRDRSIAPWLLLLSACGLGEGILSPKTVFLPANPPPRPLSPRRTEEVQLFINERPAAAFVEIGVITSQGGTTEEAYWALRQRGGELGCEGLIYGGSADRVVQDGGSVPGHRATCIVYRDPAAAPPRRAAPPEPALDTRYTVECQAPIAAWRAEKDLGKKTILYRDLSESCRAQVSTR